MLRLGPGTFVRDRLFRRRRAGQMIRRAGWELQRPDLSALQMAEEALNGAGVADATEVATSRILGRQSGPLYRGAFEATALQERKRNAGSAGGHRRLPSS